MTISIDLPTELIIYILELSYIRKNDYPDRTTLKRCSLVCTSWQHPAQRLIFRSGYLNPYKSTAQQLVQLFIGSARGLVLASYVRRIDMGIRQSAEPNYRGCYSLTEFLSILSLFPNLCEIVLRCYDRFVIPEIHRPSIPTLRSLEFWSDGETSFLLLHHFLSWWPTVQFLDITCDKFVPFLSPHRPQAILKLHLTELHCCGYCTPEFLNWLVPDPRTLRVLRLNAHGVDYSSFFKRAGQELRVLQMLKFYDLYGPVLAHCPNLTHLDIGHVYPRPSDIATLQSLPQLVPQLQYLRIRDVAPVVLQDPEPMLGAIRGLGGLRMVFVFRRYRKVLESFDAWRGLEEELRGRGGFAVWVDEGVGLLRDDPVMVEKFPRGRYVSPFRLMN